MKPISPQRGISHVLSVSIVLLFMGCATTAALRPDNESGVLGTPRYYHHAASVVFQAAQEAARQLGLTIVETAPDQSYFIARRGMTGLDWGILVGVYFNTPIDHVTRVLIRTEPKFTANIALKDYTTRLHADIRNKLESRS